MGIPNCFPPLVPSNMNQRICYQMISVKSLTDTCSCAICLKSFEITPTCRQYVKQLKCGHVFHSKCIDRWFQQKTNCPYCREEFLVNIEPVYHETDVSVSVQRNLYEDFFSDMPLAQRRRILRRPNPEGLGHTDRQLVSYLDLE